jgi:chromosome segregation ATPase
MEGRLGSTEVEEFETLDREIQQWTARQKDLFKTRVEVASTALLTGEEKIQSRIDEIRRLEALAAENRRKLDSSNEEISQLQRRIQNLELTGSSLGAADDLIQRLEQLKESRLQLLNLIAEQHKDLQSRLHVEEGVLNKYHEALGLTVESTERAGEIRFVFDGLDAGDLERKFSFCVSVSRDDGSFVVSDLKPEGLVSDQAVEAITSNPETNRDIVSLLCAFRKFFVDSSH